LAAAIKGFPALLLVYLAYRRRWRGLAAGIAVGGALTVGAMLPYGPVDAVHAVRDWMRLSSAATSIGRLGTQSLAGFTFFLGWPPSRSWRLASPNLHRHRNRHDLRRLPARIAVWAATCR